jgi:hypothetical protein
VSALGCGEIAISNQVEIVELGEYFVSGKVLVEKSGVTVDSRGDSA